jgi:hypothetical protein
MGAVFCRIDLGGRRAFAGSPRWAEVWPSGLAGAPKVASAPRGPGSAPLAGNPAQSLPQGVEDTLCAKQKGKTRLIFSMPYFTTKHSKLAQSSQRSCSYSEYVQEFQGSFAPFAPPFELFAVKKWTVMPEFHPLLHANLKLKICEEIYFSL